MKESIEPENYEDDFSFYNINSLIDFVKNNTIQIFLFILVFVIIYIVDYISNINTMLMEIQQQEYFKKYKKSKKSKK